MTGTPPMLPKPGKAEKSGARAMTGSGKGAGCGARRSADTISRTPRPDRRGRRFRPIRTSCSAPR
jgi:hypothetical protein